MLGDVSDQGLIEKIRRVAHPLIGAKSDLDPLIEKISNKKIALMGEATHGSHEFYKSRLEVTKRLIEERKFTALAIEADWPDALNLNRYVMSDDENGLFKSAKEALHSFQRFPMWMWRNTDFLETIEFIAQHNRKESTEHKVRIFGIDLYSLYHSISEVIRSLEEEDQEAADRARLLYSCFDHSHQDPVRYGRLVRIGAHPSCEDAAIKAAKVLFASRIQDTEEHFFANRNAELVRNAEAYYRNLFSPLVNTWNIRDRHMAETVASIMEYLRAQEAPDKVIVWAHNSHIGDDRATELGRHGQWNIGQLLREAFPGETFHLGFTTYDGEVTAASEWDTPPKRKTVLPARPDSFEWLFHQTGLQSFFIDLANESIHRELARDRLERAIGVIYSPESERSSHYFHARISEQFDAVIHFDRTTEVEPLDKQATEEVEAPSEVLI